MTSHLHTPPQITSHQYDADFFAWTQEQAQYLREGAWEKLDCANLSEEIESLGKQQRQELRNCLGVLLGHLLKWEFQSEMRSKSWVATIREQRREILELFRR
jgi:adenosyl cobinamide kinase/adenosyl cobinamide phosphate guanylyltransferase